MFLNYFSFRFASNAKKIKNEPKVNEVMSDTVLMRRMQKEIQSLKNELNSEKSRNSEVSLLYLCSQNSE